MTIAALVLPPIPLRDEFATLIGGALPDLTIRAYDPVAPGEVPQGIEDAEILMTFGQFLNDEVLGAMPRLRLIQGLGSGVDGIVDRANLSPAVDVASARGVHSVCVSETAFAMMLALARDIPGLVRAQGEARWRSGPANLLYGKTAGILGVGLIAEGLAARCRAFGMRVEGVSSRADAPGFDAMHDYAGLRAAVADFDYFVLLAPLSDRTRNLVDRAILDAMKPGAYLINVARGGIVDEDALIEVLRAGKLGGAGLDVFAVEPLPADSPLWSMPNVLISPHSAGQHRDYAAHVLPIVQENILAYRAGRTADLVNLVRPAS